MITWMIVFSSVAVYALLGLITARPLYNLRYEEVRKRNWGTWELNAPLGPEEAHVEARGFAAGRAALWPVVWLLVILFYVFVVPCMATYDYAKAHNWGDNPISRWLAADREKIEERLR